MPIYHFNFFALDASPRNNSKLTRKDKVVLESSWHFVDLYNFAKQLTWEQQFVPKRSFSIFRNLFSPFLRLVHLPEMPGEE